MVQKVQRYLKTTVFMKIYSPLTQIRIKESTYLCTVTMIF